MGALRAAISFFATKTAPVLQFLTNQGITTAGNLLYGLLCVRLLSTGDYTLFVVLFGVQGTFVSLMDANFSSSLIPLIGDRVHDKKLIADYVASLRQFADRLYLAVAVLLVAFFPFLVRNRGWSRSTIAAMIATLLLSTFFTRIGAVYGTVLILMRDRQRWYTGQMVASLGTLALLLAVWALHGLSAATAILINVAGNVFIGIFYLLRTRTLLGHNGKPSREKQRAIFRLGLPNVPQSVFYAVQGQISLMLITFFGHTNSVASVGALARLGQIFSIFGMMFPILLQPHFARLATGRVKKSYIYAVTATSLLALIITGASLFFPELFLWVLGPKYSSLRFEVFLSIAASALSFLSGLFWSIHTARRFIYWWNSLLNIALTLAVQVAYIATHDLSLVRSVLMLNLFTNAAALLVNFLSGAYGYLYGPRDSNEQPPPPQAKPGPRNLAATSSVT
jgi:O-antigen/teichoic acid export membrane protein